MAENTALTMSLVFKDQFSKQFQGASKQWNEGISSFKSGMASAQQSGSAALDKLGRGFGILTTPLALATVAMTAFAAAMKRGIDEAAQFESAMIFVALNLDKTMQEIEGIGEGIEKLAPAMAMTAEELAAAMEAIADAGFKGNDAMKLLERSAMLAKTTHTDLRTVIDLVTKSMVALGIGADWHLRRNT